jgi:hypothetical protein
VQKELGVRQGNWMVSLQEYDLEFRPTTIVKVQGLRKLATKAMDCEDQKEKGWQE